MPTAGADRTTGGATLDPKVRTPVAGRPSMGDSGRTFMILDGGQLTRLRSCNRDRRPPRRAKRIGDHRRGRLLHLTRRYRSPQCADGPCRTRTRLRTYRRHCSSRRGVAGQLGAPVAGSPSSFPSSSPNTRLQRTGLTTELPTHTRRRSTLRQRLKRQLPVASFASLGLWREYQITHV